MEILYLTRSFHGVNLTPLRSLYTSAVHLRGVTRQEREGGGEFLEGKRSERLARYRRSLVMVGGVAAALVLAAAGVGQAQSSGTGFDTSRPAQLVATEEGAAQGVGINPILSTGDVLGEYQMSGIPDGIGAYTKNAGRNNATLEVIMNHELGGSAPPDVGARVSHVSLDPETREILDARYDVDGTEGFLRFCSSYLTYIDGKPLYFTGEEDTAEGALTEDPNDGLGRGGTSIVLDPRTGEYTETPHFGLLRHENVVPAKGLSRAVFLTTEDGIPPENKSQLYAYIAPTFKAGISGNKGSLYVWKANEGLENDGDPSTNDIAQGETIPGRFVEVTQEENSDAATLETAVQSKGAFDFVRLEDVAESKRTDTRFYITDTGRSGNESARGRLYKLEIDEDEPRNASLTLVVDGDTSTDPVQMTNPDNLDTSENSIVIQEDRNPEFQAEDYSRVLVYDFSTKEFTAVARVDTPAGSLPGSWEPSGVLNASTLLGEDRWLLDVQAHTATAPQPGLSLEPNSSTGEDGQLLEIKIPGS
jgi:hypothetical protein